MTMTPEEMNELRERLDKLDAERTQGDYRVWCGEVETLEDAKRELCELVDGTKNFSGKLYLLEANGDCPALTGCGATSKANAEYFASAPDMMRLILAQDAEIARLRKERDLAVEGLEKVLNITEECCERYVAIADDIANVTLAQIGGDGGK